MDDSLLVNLIYKQFADRDANKKTAWKTVAAFTGSTENVCKKRWKFLKSKYERIKSGQEKQGDWELFDSMSLYDKLKDVIDSENSEGSSESEEEEMEQHIPVSNLKPVSKKKQPVPKTPSMKANPKLVEVSTKPELSSTQISQTPNKRKADKPLVEPLEKKLKSNGQANGGCVEISPKLSLKIDVAFGKYMGLEMAQIHDPTNTIKPRLRKKIQQIIQEEVQRTFSDNIS